MVEKYAQAVTKMKDITVIPEGNPTSWLFQFYSHAVDVDRTMPPRLLASMQGPLLPIHTACSRLTCGTHAELTV